LRVLLIRHASAGDADQWEGDDRLRPLDAKGLAQASRLVELLNGYEISRVLSSPAVRCVQSVEPLARERGVEIEVRDELAEARQGRDGAELARALLGEDFALCVHGGLSEAVVGESQKKGEVLLIDDGGHIVERIRS
jgi:broad specificity phosphatase PhoE